MPHNIGDKVRVFGERATVSFIAYSSGDHTAIITVLLASGVSLRVAAHRVEPS